uniref:Uncharacterized protein LOC104230077 n=1 Tax=Nicotiana sylvestris TaxID=4096 RepID=A0A1U7X2L5_NICSY|nr:PREDICTED: uncharacterized protein LOC104230077 [Nicotiana sylvestris]
MEKRTHGNKKQKQQTSHAVNRKSRVLYESLILELRIDCLTDINLTGGLRIGSRSFENRFCRRAGYKLGLPSLPVLLVSSVFVRGIFLRVIFIYLFLCLLRELARKSHVLSSASVYQ